MGVVVFCGIASIFFFFLMIRRPPRSTQSRSSAASDVYKRQVVDAEYLAEQGVCHVQFLAAGGCGDDGLVGERPGGGAAVLGAGAPAADVQAPLAVCLPGHGDGGEEGAKVGDAGQGGECFQVGAGCRCLFRRLGGGGADRVVPLAVEGAAVQGVLFEVLHPLVAGLDLVGVLGVVEDGGAFQALVGVAPI